MASISLKSINKVYPGKEQVIAVQDLDLEIKDKEFIVLVGPSGCGKSTTLRMIAGLEEITAGELKIGDTVVNDIAPKDRDIAMVFQNYALYPHMTVFENMAFGLKLRKTPKEEIKKRVFKAAEILDLTYLLNRKPKALSGGQRQRVALGRAIVREPKVFLLDEPLSNLDAKLRTQMRSEISKLHIKLGTTFVYVTHDQTEAMTMGDRIVVMKEGVVQQIDTPINLYHCPNNLFVAGFIGSPRMNIFDATLDKDGDTYVLCFGEREKLFLPESKTQGKGLERYSGKKVKAGIRPEDVIKADSPGKNIFCAKLEISEMMGSEILIYFNFAGNDTIAKFAPSTAINSGDKFLFRLDADKVHIFDKETGEVITN